MQVFVLHYGVYGSSIVLGLASWCIVTWSYWSVGWGQEQVGSGTMKTGM